jgi:hypothetical protein
MPSPAIRAGGAAAAVGARAMQWFPASDTAFPRGMDPGRPHSRLHRPLCNLERARIVRETTGRQRDRVFVYDRYLAVLNQGTEAS